MGTALAGGAVLSTAPAQAQGAAFPDVPQNHWAYQAVQDLADKGYVKGYPDAKFLGKRALTRYEFATVIDRMAQTIADLSTQIKAGTPPVTPTGTPVTQDDLNKIQVLVDGFKTQLTAIQSQVNGDSEKGTVGFQDQIDGLRQDVLDVQAIAVKAQDTANNSFGIGSSRKFQISGYIQTRYNQTGKSGTNYPQGNAAVSGAYNGNYAQGGNNESFQLRRSRLKFVGAVTNNTKFGIQLDAGGAINAGTQATNQQVTVREGYVAYTFGNGNANRFPTFTAGEFALPFGYELPTSSSNILTPERPLGFNETSNGIFANQEYDKGIQIGYNTPNQLGFVPAGLKLTAALFNGSGRNSEDTDRHIDQVYRAAYQTTDKKLGVGVSYYYGQISTAAALNAATGVVTGLGPNYARRRKQLFGADAQFALPTGPFVNAEYLSGIFEQRTAFANATAAPATSLAPGNHIESYYLQGGYTLNGTTNNPLSLFVSYDKLRRGAKGAGSGKNFNDENTGYGAAYNLDKATRLRLYYVKPTAVAHAPGVTIPHVAQTTAELQVRF